MKHEKMLESESGYDLLDGFHELRKIKNHDTIINLEYMYIRRFRELFNENIFKVYNIVYNGK